jgi:threonine dehydrogenase-like Zn-dependent dehydrogenase
MKKIAIIGAGPVGLACANWVLTKQPDAQLHLFDRMPESDDLIKQGDSRGIAVSQGAIKTLPELSSGPLTMLVYLALGAAAGGALGALTAGIIQSVSRKPLVPKAPSCSSQSQGLVTSNAVPAAGGGSKLQGSSPQSKVR